MLKFGSTSLAINSKSAADVLKPDMHGEYSAILDRLNWIVPHLLCHCDNVAAQSISAPKWLYLVIVVPWQKILDR